MQFMHLAPYNNNNINITVLYNIKIMQYVTLLYNYNDYQHYVGDLNKLSNHFKQYIYIYSHSIAETT